MHAWPAPAVPRLPGRGTPPRVYDTATSTLQPSASGPVARLYVCGITPYDATHLGHAATYVAFDLLVRAWRDAGTEVRYTQNVTDVDDPLLERAAATGEEWRALADRQTALFRDDMAALRVLAPDVYVGAVEAIPLVVDVIDRLRARGAAYDVDGDLYFPVGSDPSFGSVAGMSGEAMVAAFAERGGDPGRPGKKDPLDCLLWQRGRAGEPAWDSTLGRGRPGWHVECAAIALDHLGMGFDVQGGGSDLVFPHHEMSAAQAHALTGRRPFAQAYVHAGMVGLDGAKMSKSKGNLVLVSQLHADGHHPMAVRLALLAHHYRSDWDWTPADLAGAQRRLDRWRRAARCATGPDAGPVAAAVRDRLADDLDAPGALTVLDSWTDAALAGSGDDPSAPARAAELADALLGVALRPVG